MNALPDNRELNFQLRIKWFCNTFFLSLSLALFILLNEKLFRGHERTVGNFIRVYVAEILRVMSKNSTAKKKNEKGLESIFSLLSKCLVMFRLYASLFVLNWTETIRRLRGNQGKFLSRRSWTPKTFLFFRMQFWSWQSSQFESKRLRHINTW